MIAKVPEVDPGRRHQVNFDSSIATQIMGFESFPVIVNNAPSVRMERIVTGAKFANPGGGIVAYIDVSKQNDVNFVNP